MEANRIRMIEPGDDVKFRLTVEKEDFSVYEDDFRITVTWPDGRKREITKDDCFFDSEGRWYFTLENVRQGVYYARFRGSYEDEDYDKGRRVWNDRQVLCEVGLPPRCRRCRCSHPVRYEQVWSVSVDGADYLADCDGRYVYTSDGKRIQFTSELSEKIDDMNKIKMKMTGEEFLKKWEGRDPNGVIDTVPEMFDAARGISDDTTIKEEMDDQMEESEATDADIDEIFNT